MKEFQRLSRQIGYGSLLLATAALAIASAGCVSYRVSEIDATSATDFKWNGKVRITERVEKVGDHCETGRIVRVELCGEGDYNVVIRPDEHLKIGGRSRACAQYVGSPPDRYLTRIREEIPIFQRGWESMTACHERQAEGSTRGEAESEAFNTFLHACERIGERDFESLNGAELAFVCAFMARQLESRYEIDEKTIVRVRIEDDSLLRVTVEDAGGVVLHGYLPIELPVVEAAGA